MNIPIITNLQEAKIDAESCLVEGIILQAGLSENGTYYPKEVIEKSAGLFSGVQCYADHPSEGHAERSVRDVVGQVEKAWAEDGCIKAKIRLSRAHDWLLTMISEGLAGDLSINAMGKTKVTRRDGRVVREVLEITKAHSVDFVAKASAGGRVERILRESAAYQDGLKLLERLTPRELIESRPDLVQSVREMVLEELSRKGPDCSSEIERLEKEIEQRRIALLRESVARRIIDSSRLPERTREFLLMEALSMTCESEDSYDKAVTGLVNRHRKYLAGLSADGVISGMGSFGEDLETADKASIRNQTINFIKGR